MFTYNSSLRFIIIVLCTLCCPGPVGYVMCSNGHCALTLSQCFPAITCPLNMVRCPDGTCNNNTILCGTSPTCPTSLPVRCDDNSCVTDVSACPAPAGCGSGGNMFQCPSGQCISYTSLSTVASLCSTQITCPPSAPVLCSYGVCVTSASACNPANIITCPAALPFYCPVILIIAVYL